MLAICSRAPPDSQRSDIGFAPGARAAGKILGAACSHQHVRASGPIKARNQATLSLRPTVGSPRASAKAMALLDEPGVTERLKGIGGCGRNQHGMSDAIIQTSRALPWFESYADQDRITKM